MLEFTLHGNKKQLNMVSKPGLPCSQEGERVILEQS